MRCLCEKPKRFIFSEDKVGMDRGARQADEVIHRAVCVNNKKRNLFLFELKS